MAERVLGIRREDKNEWERRVPLTPTHVRELQAKYGLEARVQPSPIRVYPDEQYAEVGARVTESLADCSCVFAVKEIPPALFERGKVYVFFSHVIKGKKQNMPMLKRMLELQCTLIDYEKIVDDRGARLIFFGRYAGLAGMIDTLWAYGQRLRWEGVTTPLSEIRHTTGYRDLDEAMTHIIDVGGKIGRDGLPPAPAPVIFGFAGYGHVSHGAQEILDLLPHRVIGPDESATIAGGRPGERQRHLYKVVFKEEHMVEPVSPDIPFELHDYYQHPEKYRSKFETYLPHLAVLANCIYWDARYPRLVTKGFLKSFYRSGKKPLLKVLGDISCDVDGAIQCNLKTTDPGDPVYVYDPVQETIRMGVEGNGPVVLAVDNLPCELPLESSRNFGDVLMRFVPEIMNTDYSRDFDRLELSGPLKCAVIAHKGELTPDYRYIEKFF